jgi:plastocyanin
MAAPVGAVEGVTINSQVGGFQPRTVSAALGETVSWDNQDDIKHTTSGRRTLALWSRSLSPGGSADVAFRQAGTFPYLCTIHPDMTGKVRVPMTANHGSVAVGDKIVLRVATTSAPSGFRYQISRRRAGGAWAVWKTSTAKTTSWRPTGNVAGTWEFRAKTIRISNGGKSANSPVLTIAVVK